MPLNAPQVLGPDNVLRGDTIFSTTRTTRFFTGTMDSGTVDMEISIRGGGFTNNPDLITFEGTSWSVPNSEIYPEGLELLSGKNVIQIRSIAANGSVSPSLTIEVTLLAENSVTTIAEVPTSVRVEKFDGSVEISVLDIGSTNLTGFNFYASQFAGGGATGYQLLNVIPVTTATVEEEFNTILENTVTADVAVNTSGELLTDPQNVRLVQTQVDEDGNLLQSDWDLEAEIPQTARKLRTSVTVEETVNTFRYSFKHDRTATPTSTPPTIAIGAFAALPNTEPLYYVVTALYFDAEQQLELESSFSIEVVANPLKIRVAVGNFPVVTSRQITRTYTTAIQRSNPQIKVETGSVLRDTVIDPFASEAEKIRFIVDFLHRAQSFASMLRIDDPENTGSSSPVSTNSYKQALKVAFNLTRDSEVQALIDRVFEQLAGNYGIHRLPGKFSRGEVTFFTTTQPTRTISIPLGTEVAGGSSRFRTTQAAEIPFNQIAAFRDPISGRFLVRAPIQALEVGPQNDLGRGQVRRLVDVIPGLSVTNESDFFGGESIESNQKLAERAQNAIASVDTGTTRGYLQTAAFVPGVIQAKVVSAGDDLMQRDFDPTDGEHKGGKVDVWIQSGTIKPDSSTKENLAIVSDTFAFSFNIANNIQFVLISDPGDYEFRAVDPTLSPEQPIVEMLDFEDAGLGFVNATTGQRYDLTNVTITGFDTIKLDTSISQPPVDLTDINLGDYRRRTTNRFVFQRQPVREVTSVTGSVSGSLPESGYQLNRAEDPLANGRSALAGDFLTIVQTTDADGNVIPSGDFISVENENHVMTGFFPEFLDNLGVNSLTIKVYNSDKSVEYLGPNDPSGLSDYTILEGDETTPVAIQRTDTSAIASGETVLVDYEHDENFTVVYTTNLTVEVTQDKINEMRHTTADVVVKDGLKTLVDLAATVILNVGAVQSEVSISLNTNLINFFNAKRFGEAVRQSDVINVIENTSGVSYVVVPLTKMVRQPGSLVVREALATDQTGDVAFLSSLSSSTISVYILKDRLNSATTNGGGPTNEFRGVFEDDFELELQGDSYLTTIGKGEGRAAIIGSSGAVIDGYSDDQTLEDQGFVTDQAKTEERLRLTADRVLVSTLVSDSPVQHDYVVTYIVSEETIAKNIEPSDAEYLQKGDLDFTYDEEQ